MERSSRIYIAGHSGMVGSAIMRALRAAGYDNLVTRDYPQLDLTRQAEVERFFQHETPEYVIVAAARVGGIHANNTYRAEFIYQNVMIEANVIDAAYRTGCTKLLFLGSSCIYPRLAPQPLKEEYLLTAALEQSNEPYAVAKITGIKLCESYYRQYGCNFFSVMPTNLYGINDNFNLETSHVVPALIRKFHDAAASHAHDVTIWGTGTPRREFMYVDDVADAILFLMQHVNAADLYDRGISHLNIGTGEDCTIADLAALIATITRFTGAIKYDTTKLDGTPRKLLDVSRLHALGWKHATPLAAGLKRTYDWYLDASDAIR